MTRDITFPDLRENDREDHGRGREGEKHRSTGDDDEMSSSRGTRQGLAKAGKPRSILDGKVKMRSLPLRFELRYGELLCTVGGRGSSQSNA